jgi:Transposase Tn5 dimerisation domain
LLQLKTLAKHEPEPKAQNRIPSMWLKAIKALRPNIKLTTMTVYEFLRELAKQGGFLARKHDGEPGWQTIWRGYKKVQLIVKGMQLALN